MVMQSHSFSTLSTNSIMKQNVLDYNIFIFSWELPFQEPVHRSSFPEFLPLESSVPGNRSSNRGQDTAQSNRMAETKW